MSFRACVQSAPLLVSPYASLTQVTPCLSSYRDVVENKKPLPRPGCRAREMREFVFLLVVVAVVVVAAMWLIA